MFKFTYDLAMTSFNAYVHCFINCYEYLAPKNKVMILLSYLHDALQKCPAAFSHVCMELFLNLIH
jgi:hypothetical protein